MLGYGNGTSWSSTQICDWDDTSGSGLLMDGVAGSGDCRSYEAALAVDRTADELHVVWQTETTGFARNIWHAQLNTLTAPGTVGNWQDYGGSTYYQRVDNSSGDTYYPDIDVDEATNRIYIVWQDNSAGIMINSGATTAHTITASSETVIDSDTNNTRPSVVAVWGGATSADAVYVSWCNTSGNYAIEVKRCQTASSGWSTAGNWKGPASGTTTPDTAIGGWANADAIYNGGITAFHNDPPNDEQVFVCALLLYTGGSTARIYDNWFDEGDFGPTGWDSANGTYTTGGTYGEWEDAAISCGSLREDNEFDAQEDFRIVVSLDTSADGYADSSYYSDTDSGSSSWTHDSTWVQIPDATGDSDAARGVINVERHSSDMPNKQIAIISIDIEEFQSGGYTTDIYYIENRPFSSFEVDVSLGVGAGFGYGHELTMELGVSMGAGANFGFDDLNIVCRMDVGASLGVQFQVELDCDMAVTCDESAAPEDPYTETAESEPDELEWTVVCEL
jgi:hypothetical protein